MNKHKSPLWSEKGECSFARPFVDIRGVVNNDLPYLFKKVETSGDHRSLVLISALIIENNLDRLLSIFLPNYARLTKRQDFTFSFKEDLLRSLKFVPEFILTCINCVRAIRNEFAHNLEIDSLDKISLRKKSFLEQTHKSSTKADIELNNEEMFKSISSNAIIGIRLYEQNFRLLREKIDDISFIDELERLSQQRAHESIEMSLKKQTEHS